MLLTFLCQNKKLIDSSVLLGNEKCGKAFVLKELIAPENGGKGAFFKKREVLMAFKNYFQKRSLISIEVV